MVEPARTRRRGQAHRAAGRLAPVVVVLALAAAGCNLGVPPRFFPMTVDGNVLTDMALGDVNGDGHVDVVAPSYGRYGVALGDGAGHFTVTQVVVSSVQGGRMTLADIDGDGPLDMVGRAVSSGRIEVRRGDGHGHFAGTRQLLPVPGEGLVGPVRAADVDGDGDPDVVSGADFGVLVWRNDGAGGFAQPFAVDTPATPADVVMADVDADGAVDLLASSAADASSSETVVAVALGNGAGGFADAVTYPAGPGLSGRPMPVGVADLDGDTDLDVFTGHGPDPSLYVLLGHGDGSFDAPIVSPSGAPTVASVAAADIDVDGHLDIVTEAAVAFGDGAGAFVEPHEIVGGSQVVTDDFDGNGQPDVAATLDIKLNVLLNQLNGRRDHG